MSNLQKIRQFLEEYPFMKIWPIYGFGRIIKLTFSENSLISFLPFFQKMLHKYTESLLIQVVFIRFPILKSWPSALCRNIHSSWFFSLSYLIKVSGPVVSNLVNEVRFYFVLRRTCSWDCWSNNTSYKSFEHLYLYLILLKYLLLFQMIFYWLIINNLF